MGSKGIILSFFLLLTLVTTSDLLAQVRDNPFDLRPRLPETSELEEETVEESGNPFDLKGRPMPTTTETEDPRTGNPFEIGKEKADTENPFELSQVATKPVEKAKPKARPKVKESIKSLSEQRNFTFILMLINGLLITFSLTFFRSVYGKIYKALFNDNVLSLIHRERSGGAFANYLATYMVFFIVAGSFAYQVARFFELIPLGEPWLNWANCTALIVCFFLAHHLLIYLVGAIFPATKETSLYSFTVMIFAVIATIPLIIAFVCISYLPPNAIQYAIWASLILVGIMYLFRSVRGLYIGSKFLSRYTFHFLLYLCTVEIMPLLLLYKLVDNSL